MSTIKQTLQNTKGILLVYYYFIKKTPALWKTSFQAGVTVTQSKISLWTVWTVALYVDSSVARSYCFLCKTCSVLPLILCQGCVRPLSTWKLLWFCIEKADPKPNSCRLASSGGTLFSNSQMTEQKQKNKQHQTYWKELLQTSGKENLQYVGLATSRECIAWYLILEIVLLDRKTFSGKRNVNRSSRTEAPAEASQVGLCILLVLDAHGHAWFWFGLLFRKVWGIIDLRWRQTGCTMDWIQLNSAAWSCAEWVGWVSCVQDLASCSRSRLAAAGTGALVQVVHEGKVGAAASSCRATSQPDNIVFKALSKSVLVFILRPELCGGFCWLVRLDGKNANMFRCECRLLRAF